MQKILDYLAGAAKSKTIWFNAIIAALLAIEPVFGALQSFMPGNVYAYLSVLLAVGNAILRTVTSQHLLEKGSA